MKTDYIMEHIKMLCNVTSGEQKKYYQRQLDCAKPIECVSIREVLSEKDIDLIKSISILSRRNVTRTLQGLRCCFLTELNM